MATRFRFLSLSPQCVAFRNRCNSEPVGSVPSLLCRCAPRVSPSGRDLEKQPYTSVVVSEPGALGVAGFRCGVLLVSPVRGRDAGTRQRRRREGAEGRRREGAEGPTSERTGPPIFQATVAHKVKQIIPSGEMPRTQRVPSRRERTQGDAWCFERNFRRIRLSSGGWCCPAGQDQGAQAGWPCSY